MKYPIAEVCDRYTIEVLKSERTLTENDRNISILYKEIELNKKKCSGQDLIDYQTCIDNLYYFNGKIWDLESDIRKGKEGELGLEEVGRRALAIRDLNGHRILQKNKIASIFGEMGEKKYNHASE